MTDIVHSATMVLVRWFADIRRCTGMLLIAAAIALGQVGGQVATLLSGPGTVLCCCGEHAADHACDCPDCPAAVGQQQTAQRDNSLRNTPAFRTCSQEGPETLLSAASDWAPPPDPPASPPAARTPAPLLVEQTPTQPFYRPEAPPS